MIRSSYNFNVRVLEVVKHKLKTANVKCKEAYKIVFLI